MPVVIKDFEVVGNGQSPPEPAATQPTAPAPPQSLSVRQIAQIIKRVKERARRLHAD